MKTKYTPEDNNVVHAQLQNLAKLPNLKAVLQELQSWRKQEITDETLLELSAKNALKNLIRRRNGGLSSLSHYAASNGNIELLDSIANFEQALLKTKKEKNTAAAPTHFFDKDIKGRSPLSYFRTKADDANKEGEESSRVAKLLTFLAKEAPIFQEALSISVETGNYDWFIELINANPKLLSSTHSTTKQTFLHYAVIASAKNQKFDNPQLELLRKLFSNPDYRDLIDINAQDTGGYTPLHHACHYGDQHMIEFLLKCQADIWALNTAKYEEDRVTPSMSGHNSEYGRLMRGTVEYKWERVLQREGRFNTAGTTISKADTDALWVNPMKAWQDSADKDSFILIAQAMKTQLEKGYDGSSNAARCKRFLAILEQPTEADKALIEENEFTPKEKPKMFSLNWVSDLLSSDTDTEEHWLQRKEDAKMKIALWEVEFSKEQPDSQKQLLLLHEVIKHFRKEVKADLLAGKVNRVGGGFLAHLGYFSNKVQELAMLNELTVQTGKIKRV